MTTAGLIVTEATVGSVMVSEPFTVTLPRLAEMVANVEDATAVVLTVNVADV